MPKRHWYYQKPDGKRHGPYSSRRMKKLARRGHLSPRDRVWKANSQNTFLAADFPQLYLRAATHRTWQLILNTLVAMAGCFFAAAVTNPWSKLASSLPTAVRPWLTGFCLASLTLAVLAGAVGFLKLDATYMMIPPKSIGHRRSRAKHANSRGRTSAEGASLAGRQGAARLPP